MDQDYLKHLAGSSQVDEGFGSQLAARAASTGQRFSAMTGGSIQDLDTTKIKSLYFSFIKKIKSVLQDFSEGNNSVATRLLQRKDISPQQRELINKIKQMLIEIDQEVRVAQGAELRPYDPSNDTQSPPDANPYIKRNKIAELVEGFFTRDFALNKALQTNNPSVIINAYVQKLTQLLSSFSTDVSKITKVPVDFIQKTLGKINPAYAKRYFDVRQIIDMSRPPALPASAQTTPAATEPTATTPTPPAAATTAAGTPPPLPTTTIGQNIPTNAISQLPIPPSDSSGEISNEFDKYGWSVTGENLKNAAKLGGKGNDFAIIVGHVIDIVVKNITTDSFRSDPYFKDSNDKKKFSKLATSYDQDAPHAKAPPSGVKAMVPPFDAPPATIEEVNDGEDDGDDTGKPRKSTSKIKYKDKIEGEFLYNFRSEFKKSRKSSIMLDNFGKDEVLLSNNIRKTLKVILSWNSGENNIIIKHKDSSNKAESAPWHESVLFKFWDADANYQSPAFKGASSINTYIYNADPYGENLLKKADPAVLEDLNKKQNVFNRALYAISHRKAMEYSGIPDSPLDLTMNDDGTIIVHGNPGYKQSQVNPYGKDTIAAILNSDKPEIRDPWIESLTSIGYFDKFPEMKPVLSKNSDEAAELLVAEFDIDKIEADKIVRKAVTKIKGSEKMTGPVLAAVIKKSHLPPGLVNVAPPTSVNPPVAPPSPTTPVAPTTPVKKSTSKVKAKYPFLDIPAARDAFLILTKLMSVGKGKKPSTRELLKTMQAVVDKEGNGLSKEQYYAKAKADPPEPPEPSEEDYGKVRINMDNGSVNWTKPGTDIVRHFTANQLKNTASRKLWAALKKKGYPFEKFGVKTDVEEEIINSFQLSNFL